MENGIANRNEFRNETNIFSWFERNRNRIDRRKIKEKKSNVMRKIDSHREDIFHQDA